MQAAFPNTVLVKITNRKEPFVHSRSDGRHVIFGFSPPDHVPEKAR